ncbi:ATP-binding protein [Pseudonocardia ailaonensis]|uniref:histidine kinase n=1 Tax=Pseudonocardia ailaonensis TaxID=367279 RepID=A0ABN2NNE1_9PSEU
MGSSARRGRPLSLRTRLLAGILVPGLLVFTVAAVVGGREVASALEQAGGADTIVRDVRGPVGGFFQKTIAERAASIRFVADQSPANRQALVAARGELNQVVTATAANLGVLQPSLPATVLEAFRAFGTSLEALPTLRERVDNRSILPLGVVEGFAPMTDTLNEASLALASTADDDVASGLSRAADLLRAGDLLDRATSLAHSRPQRGIDVAELTKVAQLYGVSDDLLRRAVPLLTPEAARQVDDLQETPEWKNTQAAVVALLASRLSGPATLAVSLDDAQAAAASAQLVTIGGNAYVAAQRLAETRAQASLTTTLLLVGGLLLGLAAITVISGVVASRVVRRLGRLRSDTLALADRTLPETVRRLRAGERLDIDEEVPVLDYGTDEIGQVAAAFNHAQRTAVQVAVDEASARSGFNAAFLNIARRSQAILHQQIQVLDRVERTESDPDQLELLFRLDHLTTRERRNAENLIILGGERPRRRWRNPVALSELVRGAVGEAEQYQRVALGNLPEVQVAGPAVGDLVHLLAELIDNATAFSPPESPIVVRGSVAGRGIAVEVEDQGLGIEEERLAELNRVLADPPDFGLFRLTEDTRIGLFVVAWLARRHGVTVSLRYSPYGGVLAGVLIPNEILVVDDVPGAVGRVDLPAQRTSPPAARDEAVPPAGRGTPAAPEPDPAVSRGQRGTVRGVPLRGRPQITAGQHVADPGGALPSLPRRRRQAHMNRQLQDTAVTPLHAPPVAEAASLPSPEQARQRMSAWQRNSRAVRQHLPAGTEPSEESP